MAYTKLFAGERQATRIKVFNFLHRFCKNDTQKLWRNMIQTTKFKGVNCGSTSSTITKSVIAVPKIDRSAHARILF